MSTSWLLNTYVRTISTATEWVWGVGEGRGRPMIARTGFRVALQLADDRHPHVGCLHAKHSHPCLQEGSWQMKAMCTVSCFTNWFQYQVGFWCWVWWMAYGNTEHRWLRKVMFDICRVIISLEVGSVSFYLNLQGMDQKVGTKFYSPRKLSITIAAKRSPYWEVNSFPWNCQGFLTILPTFRLNNVFKKLFLLKMHFT